MYKPSDNKTFKSYINLTCFTIVLGQNYSDVCITKVDNIQLKDYENW